MVVAAVGLAALAAMWAVVSTLASLLAPLPYGVAHDAGSVTSAWVMAGFWGIAAFTVVGVGVLLLGGLWAMARP